MSDANKKVVLVGISCKICKTEVKIQNDNGGIKVCCPTCKGEDYFSKDELNELNETAKSEFRKSNEEEAK